METIKMTMEEWEELNNKLVKTENWATYMHENIARVYILYHISLNQIKDEELRDKKKFVAGKCREASNALTEFRAYLRERLSNHKKLRKQIEE